MTIEELKQEILTNWQFGSITFDAIKVYLEQVYQQGLDDAVSKVAEKPKSEFDWK